jgi:hypothetical protein
VTIVCRSRKFIFVHLTKCGGTSVEQAFAPHARWNDLIVGSTAWGERLQPVYRRLFGLTKHSPARQIEQSLGAEVWAQYWTVALVRHPLRVYESFYAWMADVAEDYMRDHRLDRDQLVERYRKGALRAWFTDWWIAKPYLESTCFAEFMDIVLTQPRTPRSMTARLSRDGTVIVDDVFKLEDIDRFWETFEARTGLKLERLHVNQSRSRRYQWDESHIAEIRRRFAIDFRNFGYD